MSGIQFRVQNVRTIYLVKKDQLTLEIMSHTVLYPLLWPSTIYIDRFNIVFFRIWKKICPFMSFQLKCPDFPTKMSGILFWVQNVRTIYLDQGPINIITNEPYSVYMFYYDQLMDLVNFSSEFGRKLVRLCVSSWNVRIFHPKCPGS